MSESPKPGKSETGDDKLSNVDVKTVEKLGSEEDAGKNESCSGLDETGTGNDATLDESCVYMTDLVKEQEEDEMEAMVVLGGSDENNCTYSKGYIKRQAIYSCLTCVKEQKEDASKRAGICLACSLTCHENHELVELYTKRNFRCDCGGAKMKSVRCQLEPIKFGVNEDNKYNQNFSGVYCVCKRPYPDPEDNIVDEMIQCVICEDWYHGRHLNTAVVKDFNEMVCGGCVDAHPFLKCYLEYSMQGKKETDPVEVVTSADETTTSNKKRPLTDASTSSDAKRPKLDCDRPEPEPYPANTAIFWADAWRDRLCKCPECLEMYKQQNVEFLIDSEDPVQKYEEIGLQRTRNSTSQEREMEALSSLGRTQQVEMITGYNRFRDRLKEFLAAFAVNRQTVTEEDVNRFFAMMKDEKAEKQGLPYFCR